MLKGGKRIIQQTKEQRHRIKSALPKRRIAKQAAKLRIFNLPNAKRLAFEALLKEKTVLDTEGVPYLIKIDRTKNSFAGTKWNSVYLKIGSLTDPKTGRRIHLLFRTNYNLYGGYVGTSYSQRNYELQKLRLQLLRKKGLPVTGFSEPVEIDGILGRPLAGAIEPDPSEGGRYEVSRQVFKLQNSGAKNAKELEKELERYIKIIRGHGAVVWGEHPKEDYYETYRRHPPDPKNEIKKCFLVIVDKKSKEGKLVLRDVTKLRLNNVDFNLPLDAIDKINRGESLPTTRRSPAK